MTAREQYDKAYRMARQHFWGNKRWQRHDKRGIEYHIQKAALHSAKVSIEYRAECRKVS